MPDSVQQLLLQYPIVHDFLKYTKLHRWIPRERELLVDSGVYDVRAAFSYPYTIASHYYYCKNTTTTHLIVVPDYPIDMCNLGFHNIYLTNTIHDYYMQLSSKLVFTVQSAFEQVDDFINNYWQLIDKILLAKERNAANTVIGLGNLCLSKDKAFHKEFSQVALCNKFTHHCFAPNIDLLKAMTHAGMIDNYSLTIDTSKFSRPISQKKLKKILGITNTKNLPSAPKKWRHIYLAAYLDRIIEIVT